MFEFTGVASVRGWGHKAYTVEAFTRGHALDLIAAHASEDTRVARGFISVTIPKHPAPVPLQS